MGTFGISPRRRRRGAWRWTWRTASPRSTRLLKISRSASMTSLVPQRRQPPSGWQPTLTVRGRRLPGMWRRPSASLRRTDAGLPSARSPRVPSSRRLPTPARSTWILLTLSRRAASWIASSAIAFRRSSRDSSSRSSRRGGCSRWHSASLWSASASSAPLFHATTPRLRSGFAQPPRAT